MPYLVIAACIEVCDDRIIYRTGISTQMEVFCLCGKHTSTLTSEAAPLLRVWNDPERQTAFLQSILQNSKVVPLDQSRKKLLHSLTHSITGVSPKFIVSPVIMVLL